MDPQVLLVKLSNMEQLFNYSEILGVVEKSGTITLICRISVGIAFIVWLIATLQPIIRGRFEEYLPNALHTFYVLLFVVVVVLNLAFYKLIFYGICGFFGQLTNGVFNEVSVEFAGNMRLMLDAIKNQSERGVDLLTINMYKMTVEQFVTSLALITLLIIVYVYVNYGVILIVFAFVIGPVALSLYRVIPDILYRWIGFVIGAATITPFIGLVLLTISKMRLMLIVTDTLTTGGSFINVVFVALVMVILLPAAMVLHAGIFGIHAINIPNKIFGIIYLLSGNLIGFLTLQKKE